MDPSLKEPAAPCLSRVERRACFHVDCEDEIVWRNWAVGCQSTRQFVLKNIGSVKQTFHYNSLSTDVFSVGTPEHFTLPPGMSRSICVSFVPKTTEPVVDTLDIFTQTGSFTILLKAVVKEPAVTFPREITFGCVPVGDETTVPFLVHNTGSLPARVTWKDCEPFKVVPTTFSMPVGQSRKCTAVIRPPVPMVYEGTLVLELVSEAESAVNTCTSCAAEDVIDKEFNPNTTSTRNSSSSRGSQDSQKFYELVVRGIGKLPHIHVGGKTEVHLDFGEIPSGTAASKSIMLENASSVRAQFRVSRILREEEEHNALVPYTVTARTCMGVIQSGKSRLLTFDFEASAATEPACHLFKVTTSSGVPLLVWVRGTVKPLEIALSQRWLAYNRIPVGGHKVLRSVQLRNASKRSVTFQFDNTYPASFIGIEPCAGTLPPRSITNVTFSFLPKTPLSFHKRVFCFVQHVERPLVLDIVGSCCTPAECPPPVTIGHVYLKRWRQLNAAGPPKETLEYDCHGVLTYVPEPLETAATLFHDMLQSASLHASRDLTIAPDTLKFKNDETTRVLTITNRTDRNWTCTWKDAYCRRQTGYMQVFRVFPARANVLPWSTTSFQVSYDGHGVPPEYTDHCQLEAVLYPCPSAAHTAADVYNPRVPMVVSCYARGSCLTPCSIPLSLDVHVSEPRICFKNCIVGESVFRTTLLVNNGDTAVSFDVVQEKIADVPESDNVTRSVFGIWPMCGCIPPRSSRALVLSFEPRIASNWSWMSEEFYVVLNENASSTKSIRVFGRAWEPIIDLEDSPVVFASTPLGSVSERNIKLRNASSIQVRVLAELSQSGHKVFSFNVLKEVLGPLEESVIHCTFSPLAAPGYSALLSVTAEALPTDAAAWKYRHGNVKDAPPLPKKTECVRLTGRTASCPFKVSPASITLGPILAYTKTTHEIVLRNDSNASTHYKVLLQRIQPRSSLSVPEENARVGEEKRCDELMFLKTTGELACNSEERIAFDFHPTIKQRYRYRVRIVQLRSHSVGSDEGKFNDLQEFSCQEEKLQGAEVLVEAEVVHPAVQILDLRCLNQAVAPSRLWHTVNVELLNRHFGDDVQPCEVEYLKAAGLDQRRGALQKLQTFDMDFGAAPVDSERTVFLLTLHNPGVVPVRVYFETGRDLNLLGMPTWALRDSPSDTPASEDPVYLEPRALRLEVDEFAPVLLSFDNRNAGQISADVIMAVERGKSAVLRLRRQALTTRDFPFFFRSSLQVLKSVRLGSNPGPRQVLELVNFGSSDRRWRLELNDKNNFPSGFSALKIDALEGSLGSCQATHVPVTFTPFQKGTVEFSLICHEGDRQENPSSCSSLEVRIQACGQLQSVPEPLSEERELSDILIRGKGIAPVTMAASLSSEVIMLPNMRRRSLVHRILILRNNHTHQMLRFCWDRQELFSSVGDLKISPSTGILPPGGDCIIHCVFLSALEEFHIDGEIVCWTAWDNPPQDSTTNEIPAGSEATGAFCPLPPPPYLWGIQEEEQIHTREAQGAFCSDTESENAFTQVPGLRFFATQILTDMVHDAIDAEWTREFVDRVTREASPPFASIFPAFSNGNSRQAAAADHECETAGRGILGADNCSKTTFPQSVLRREDVCADEFQDGRCTPWGVEIREDYNNWSPLVMNFLHCLPTLGSPQVADPPAISHGTYEEPEGAQEAATPLVDYLATLPSIHLESLPIIVGTVFRQFIIQAIEQMLLLKEPEDSYQQHSKHRDETSVLGPQPLCAGVHAAHMADV